MQKIVPIEHGKYYHIYNCGIDGCELFRETKDYQHFLKIYENYIEPTADTFAWCLMGNHFHFLVRIKEEEEIVTFYESHRQGLQPLAGQGTAPAVDKIPAGGSWKIRKPSPSKQFSHLFNAYAQYFNNKYNRRGSLFIKPFKRKPITNENYFRRVAIYIHNNPVHHGFVEHPIEYPWSSYQTCISIKPTRLKRDVIIGWFDDLANFKALHEGKVEYLKMEAWLEI